MVTLILSKGIVTMVSGSNRGRTVGSSSLLCIVSGLICFDSTTVSVDSNRLTSTELALFTKSPVGPRPRGRKFI